MKYNWIEEIRKTLNFIEKSLDNRFPIIWKQNLQAKKKLCCNNNLPIVLFAAKKRKNICSNFFAYFGSKRADPREKENRSTDRGRYRWISARLDCLFFECAQIKMRENFPSSLSLALHSLFLGRHPESMWFHRYPILTISLSFSRYYADDAKAELALCVDVIELANFKNIWFSHFLFLEV